MATAIRKAGPGRPKDPQRRNRLLAIARRAFADLGYDAASLSEIATRAEVTKAALLHHFGSKEAMYFAVLGTLVADLGAFVTEALSGSGEFRSRLDRLGESVVDYLGADPCAAKLLLSELVGRGPFARGPGGTQVTAAMRAVRDFLASGIDSGDVRPQSPEQLAMSIVSIHLVYFAAADVTETLIGESPFRPAQLEQRKKAVTAAVRALCGDGS